MFATRGGVVEHVDASTIVVDPGDPADPAARDQYRLSKFRRSNQGSNWNQRPVVRPGERVRPGWLLADGPAMDHGELALGSNLVVAFMPWGGYNYEDSILVSERLLREDLLTSLHIEELECVARDTKLGVEEITRDIPNLGEGALHELDEAASCGSAPRCTRATSWSARSPPRGRRCSPPRRSCCARSSARRRPTCATPRCACRPGSTGSSSAPSCSGAGEEGGAGARASADLPPGVRMVVKVSLATKRKLSVGDKLAGRHGNKGVVSRILPEEDMPYLEDGTPVDVVLNPLGVPSRMNIGQILETHLGWAARESHAADHRPNGPPPALLATPVFDGATEADIKGALRAAGLSTRGQAPLYDGRTGMPFQHDVTIGVMYVLKLHHLVDEKIHARSVGPYSLGDPAAARGQVAPGRASGSARWRSGPWRVTAPRTPCRSSSP